MARMASTGTTVPASHKQAQMSAGVDIPQLNENELQVLRLLNVKLQPRQIAAQLDYADVTIRKRIAAINRKFGTNSYHASVLLARLFGMVKAPPGP
jgi:DNA-binding CsgD family transcriptional regulator